MGVEWEGESKAMQACYDFVAACDIYERTAPSRHRAYLISSMEDLPSLEFGNFNLGDSTQ